MIYQMNLQELTLKQYQTQSQKCAHFMHDIVDLRLQTGGAVHITFHLYCSYICISPEETHSWIAMDTA